MENEHAILELDETPPTRLRSGLRASRLIGRRFGRRLRHAGLPAIRLHDLRHTYATLLLADGVDAKTTSERLGHDSVETTPRLYAHVTARMREGAAARGAARMMSAEHGYLRAPLLIDLTRVRFRARLCR